MTFVLADMSFVIRLSSCKFAVIENGRVEEFLYDYEHL